MRQRFAAEAEAEADVASTSTSASKAKGCKQVNSMPKTDTSSPGARPRGTLGFAPGDVVSVFGLQSVNSMPYNGRVGRLLAFNARLRRWRV